MESDFEKSFHDFTENLSINLPELTEDKKNALEVELTLKECKEALMCLGSGKTPGKDGFTVEFYKFFFKLIGQEFVDSINASF